VPNLLRETKYQQTQETQEVLFSDIFEVCLADRTKVRGCFALWKRTRHILALVFADRMEASLVVSTINQVQFSVPATILHSDQGSQYDAEQTRAALFEKGFIRSMSRAGTPTDNGYAERFVGSFKQAVAERTRYQTLGHFLQAAECWINFYNHARPHEGLGNCSPDQFAAENGLPSAPYLSLH
jgi:putative transposase